MNPAAGVKEFSGLINLIAFIAIASVYAYFSIRFNNIEASIVGEGMETKLRNYASAAIPAGVLIAFICGKIKSEAVRPVFGYIFPLFSLLFFDYTVLMSVINESSGLWRLESVVEFLAVSSCIVLLFTLLLSEFGVRIKPQVSSVTIACCAVAAILVITRLVMSTSTLQSAIGDNYDFTLAEDEFGSELRWMFRRIDSPKATTDAYLARILERAMLACYYGCVITFSLNYRKFFEEYNRQMDFSTDLPDAYVEVIRREPRRKISAQKKAEGKEMPSKGSNTVIESDDDYIRSQRHRNDYDDDYYDDDYRQRSERRRQPAGYDNDYDDEYDNDYDDDYYDDYGYDDKRESEEDSFVNRLQQQLDRRVPAGNSRSLYHPYTGDEFDEPERKPAPRVSVKTSDGRKIAVKVKAPQSQQPRKPSLPPEDSDLWDNYSD